MLECPFCFQYFHPVCIGVPDPDAAEYAKVWACESCHERDGMPPHPSFWYRVQKCHPKNVHEGLTCEACVADEAALEHFRKAMKDGRRVLPKTVKELKKAGETYKRKWFKPIKEEGYAASQSDHSSPTAKLTSSYLHPQVRRHGLVRRRTWCVHLHSHARETPAEKVKARAATRPQLPKHKKKSTRILSRKRKK